MPKQGGRVLIEGMNMTVEGNETSVSQTGIWVVRDDYPVVELPEPHLFGSWRKPNRNETSLDFGNVPIILQMAVTSYLIYPLANLIS